jgi:hypothetical protein
MNDGALGAHESFSARHPFAEEEGDRLIIGAPGKAWKEGEV